MDAKCPQRGLAALIRRISAFVFERPERRDRSRQWMRKHLRCYPVTGAGLTSTKVSRSCGCTRWSQTQNHVAAKHAHHADALPPSFQRVTWRSCTWICQCPALVERAFASEPAGQHCIGQRQTIAEGTFRRIPDRKCWLNSVLLLGYVAIGIVGQQGGRDDADDSIEKDVHRNRPA